MTSRELIISGGICLLPGRGLVAADVVCGGGSIAAIRAPGSGGAGGIDAAGCLVLPGIVDIHGDAFERQIMPRPGTIFPLDIAMLDTDRQLVANGITTAYHGVTVSWEPGLRSLAQSLQIIGALDRLEPDLLADNRLHIRWETYALDEMDAVLDLLARPKTPLLAFNDHTSPLPKLKDPQTAYRRHAERAMVETGLFIAQCGRMLSRAEEVPAAVAAMAAAARSHGVPMLSHDDRSPDERSFFRGLGVRIAEFPVTAGTLAASAAGGDLVVLGSPNVVRGGSHTGAIGAEQAVREGKCAILASDYYYPAMLRAALLLAARGVLPLERAWGMISAVPAEAAGLADRGRIAEGLRADIVVLDEKSQLPVATVAGGKPVYRSR